MPSPTTGTGRRACPTRTRPASPSSHCSSPWAPRPAPRRLGSRPSTASGWASRSAPCRSPDAHAGPPYPLETSRPSAVQHLVRGLHHRAHLREPEEHRLVVGALIAEGLALLGVGRPELERAPRDPAAARRHVHLADLDAAHYLVEAPARLAAQDPVGADPEAVEDQLGRVDALVAHLLDLPRHGQTWSDLAEPGGLLHQQGRHVSVHGSAPVSVFTRTATRLVVVLEVG